jgi:hypothetical protein
MPIPNYDGNTFVSFTDISGFKEMMKRDNCAIIALDQFYAAGYNVLQANKQVHGIFVSDCAVLFVNTTADPLHKLTSLLRVIEQLNRELLIHDVMLTTCIAYGRFSYHQRLEFPGIEKNPIFGNAYVAAFIDHESGKPALQPGQCRLVAQGLDQIDMLQIPRLKHERGHHYFYWMAQNEGSIPAFTEKYADAYQQKYRGMLEAIKDAANNRIELIGDTVGSPNAHS